MRRKRQIDGCMVQIQVDCHAKIRKRMRANLADAARDRVNVEGAGIARAILESTEVKPQVAVAGTSVSTVRPSPSVCIAQPVQPPGSRRWHWAKAGFRKAAKYISGSIKTKRVLRPAHWCA